MTKKLMVIGAHPADPFDLAGGTIFQMVEYRWRAFIVTVTHGANSHMEHSDTLSMDKQRKRDEFFAAVKTIANHGDWHSKTLEADDEPLYEGPDLFHEIVNLIRHEKPDIIITHHPNEYAHFDHSVCGLMVCKAMKAAYKWPGKNRYKVPMAYFFGVQFRPESARMGVIVRPPDILIGLTEEAIDAKINAMCCFRTQGITLKMMAERVDSMEREAARADGAEFDHAEAFTFYRPLRRRILLDGKQE